MANLLEAYKNRIAIANKVYAKTHAGEPMSEMKQLILAKCIDNTSRFINEALDNSAGVQRAQMGAYKKFALSLTNVALPTLIAPELVIVNPMSSFTGYVTYLDYTSGSTKAPYEQGDLFNGAFALGNSKGGTYTSSTVAMTGTTSASQQTVNLNWTPVVAGTVVMKIDGVTQTETTAGTSEETYTLTGISVVTRVTYDGTDVTADCTIDNAAGTVKYTPAAASKDVVITGNAFYTDTASGSNDTTNARHIVLVRGAVSVAKTTNTDTGITSVVFYDAAGNAIAIAADTATSANAIGFINSLGIVRANPAAAYQPPVGGAYGSSNQPGAVLTLNASKFSAGFTYTLDYVYNNEYVPQNDVPLLNVEVKAIPLVAKVRRIAVYYSQIAAYQAKTDYNFDLQEQLSSQAVGRLSYEIDTEVVNFLANIAKDNGDQLPIWDRTVPVGISRAEHYEGFAEALQYASTIIYNRTKRFAANYVVVAADLIPVLHFMKGFTAAPAGKMNGPYFAGTADQLKVFVSPELKTGEYFVGVNGDDMMSSAAVYAPYMPIVPTQLLQGPDGGSSIGFSTLYDLKALNKNLVVYGQVAGNPLTGVFGTTASPVYTKAVV